MDSKTGKALARCAETMAVSMPWVLGLIVFFIVLWMPYFSDDLHYLTFFRDWLAGVPGAQGPLDDYPAFIAKFRSIYNGRTADVILPFTLYIMPRWLFAAITGLLFAVALRYAQKIASITQPLTASNSLWLMILLMVLPPWYSVMNGLCYMCNYLWSIGTLLPAIYVMLTGRGLKTFTQSCCCWALCLIAGSWHEGPSAMAGLAIIAWFIYMRGRIGRRQTTAIILFGIGAIISIATPAIWTRQPVTISDSLSRAAVFVLPMAAFLIATIAALSIPRLAARLDKRQRALLVFLSVCVAVNFIFLFAAFTGARVLWWGDILSITGLTMLYQTFSRRTHSKISSTLTPVVISCLLVVQGIFCIVRQYDMHRIEQRIITEYKAAPDQPVYIDIPSFNPYDFLYLGHISVRPLEYNLIYYTDILAPGSKYVSTIPTCLRDVAPNDSMLVNKSYKLYNIKGKWVWNPDFEIDNVFRTHLVTTHLNNGATETTLVEIMPYTVGNDTLYYLEPYTRIGNIVHRIDIIDVENIIDGYRNHCRVKNGR